LRHSTGEKAAVKLTAGCAGLCAHSKHGQGAILMPTLRDFCERTRALNRPALEDFNRVPCWCALSAVICQMSTLGQVGELIVADWRQSSSVRLPYVSAAPTEGRVRARSFACSSSTQANGVEEWTAR